MTELKIVIGDPKTGKSYQRTLNEQDSEKLIGLKIGNKVDGSLIGLSDYELEITGGSDYCGFVMTPSLEGSGKKKIFLERGPGFRLKKRAKKHSQDHYHVTKRKTVRGNTISHRTSQINLKILKHGTKKIEEIFNIVEKTEEKPIAKKEEKTKKPAKHEKVEDKTPMVKDEVETKEVKSGEEKK